MPEQECPKCAGTGVVIDREQLKMRRLKSGRQLLKVAAAMDISPSYLSDLEHGRRDWNAELLAKFNAVMPKK